MQILKREIDTGFSQASVLTDDQKLSMPKCCYITIRVLAFGHYPSQVLSMNIKLIGLENKHLRHLCVHAFIAAFISKGPHL